MSRSGYCDDYDGEWALIRWRGAVASAIRGKHGQAFLREMLAALDALPAPRLIKDDLENDRGGVCAIGAVGRARGTPMAELDPEDSIAIGKAFGIARALAAEIEFINDEASAWEESDETRFIRVRQWILAQIKSKEARPDV